ncbi:uncharacterized protein F4812DRAFT_160186 [Daldinia caldariorum]|uniref:uncharacterized protein n=1 Tax=Daldinia caldariorum TaxID=326644 RepID=UPI0020084384|nr:uncharacterized protein F4812DRAFT_160186 [Daldinia caldariorum]KAI1464586.1 hypothetical protein F4812DRAFT_160186 [Daldinia caldariorum]
MFLQILHFAQATLAIYGGRQSYVAITNLRKYEDATKKAARVSKEAERQRQQTYATQTTGVVTLLFSFFMSVLLAREGSIYGFLPRFLAPAATIAAVYFARKYIRGFWAGKTPGVKGNLPNMGDYDDAEKRTHELLNVLDLLMYSWIATLALAITVGY